MNTPLFQNNQDYCALPLMDEGDVSTNFEKATIIMPEHCFEEGIYPFFSTESLHHLRIRLAGMAYLLSGVHTLRLDAPWRELSPNLLRFRLPHGAPQKIGSQVLEEMQIAEFAPTSDMVDLVIAGIASTASDLYDTADTNPPSKEEASLLLSEQITYLFARIADLARQKGISEFPLSKNGNFIDAVDIAMCENIPLRPRDAPIFSDLLHLQLSHVLVSGGAYAGGWGELKLIREGLLLIVKEKKVVLLAPRKKRPKAINVEI